jgi:hypothetical protein
LAFLEATLIFAGWEVAVGASAAQLVYLLGWNRKDEPSPAQAFAAWLALDILVACAIASLFSFARFNYRAVYALVGAGLAVAGFAFPRALGGFVASLRRLALFDDRWTLAGILALWIPVFCLSFRPVGEIDSLNYLHFLLEWMANRATPYAFATNYVAFWESGFLPGWILTRTDFFFPLIALKAVVLVAVALSLVGVELGLPRRLVLWTAAGTIALQHFWSASSGVGTLKNDAPQAAGAVLLCLTLLRASRGEWGRREAVLLTLGAVFASVKYSGVILAFVALGAVAVLRIERGGAMRSAAPRYVLPALAGGAVWLATCGHYYVRTLLQHGNPFYPFQIDFLGLRLPGLGDLSYTSILGNLHRPDLWRLLFWPAGGISPAGLLFPLTLAAGLITPLAYLITGVSKRRRPSPAWWLALYILAGWILYFRSCYSASGAENDLGYMRASLNSIRYAEGILGLSELFLIWLLWRSRVPRWTPFVLAGAGLLSRLAILYSQIPAQNFRLSTLLLIAAISAAAALRLSSIAVPVTALALLIACPWLVERNRAQWQFWWKDIYRPVAELRPSSIYLIEDDRAGYFAGHILLAGNPLRHQVRAGSNPELRDRLAHGDRPQFIVHLLTPDLPNIPAELAAFRAAYGAAGYRPAIEGKYGLVLEHFGRSALTEPHAKVWYAFGGGMPEIGTQLEDDTHTLAAGDLALTEAGMLIRMGADENSVVEAQEGAQITVQNCGQSGLDYSFAGGIWTPQLSGLTRLNPNYDFSSDRTWEISVSQGAYRVDHLTDATGPFVRLTALAETQWLVWVGRFPQGLPDRTPLTVRALIRCPENLSCKVWFARPETTSIWSGPADGAWHVLRYLERPRTLKIQDYYAAGRTGLKRGEYFDIREFSLLRGYYP